MSDSFQEPAFLNSRQECLTHGAILAISILFPNADEISRRSLMSQIFPYMSNDDIDYWLSWHNGYPIRSCDRSSD